MGYLIDTCIWIDVEQGVLGPVDIAQITQDEPVFLSPVTLAELKFGAEMAVDLQTKQKRLMALQKLHQKPLIRIDEMTADIFGSLAAHLKKEGKSHRLRVQDLWLASQAIQHSLTLLTHNTQDFTDIPGLTLRAVRS